MSRKILIFTLSSFLGDEAVSGGFLARIVPAPPFTPFIVLITLDFLILSRNLLASGRAT